MNVAVACGSSNPAGGLNSNYQNNYAGTLVNTGSLASMGVTASTIGAVCASYRPATSANPIAGVIIGLGLFIFGIFARISGVAAEFRDQHGPVT